MNVSPFQCSFFPFCCVAFPGSSGDGLILALVRGPESSYVQLSPRAMAWDVVSKPANHVWDLHGIYHRYTDDIHIDMCIYIYIHIYIYIYTHIYI